MYKNSKKDENLSVLFFKNSKQCDEVLLHRLSLIVIAITYKADIFENLRQLTIIKTLLYIWENARILMMVSISIIIQKYGFDMINTLIHKLNSAN